MRKAHQILAGLLAALVVVQAMAIAYALAGLGHWVDKTPGAELNHKTFNSLIDGNGPHFRGEGGFAIHGIDGMNVIPLVVILLLIVSLFAKIPGGAARAGILFVMVAVQIALGLSAHDVIALAPLHALNAFGIFAMAIVTVRKARESAPAPEAVAA